MELKKIESLTVVAPAHWVFPIAYDDWESLSNRECKAVCEWLDSLSEIPGFLSVCMGDSEPWFDVWLGDWGQPGVKAGDVCEYIVLVSI